MSFRKALFWTHLAVGFTAGVVILSMALTGILISYEPQIVAWAERDRRTLPGALPGSVSGALQSSARLSLDRIAALAAKEAPKGRPSAVTVKADPSATVAISFGKEGGNLYVNPYSGEVLGKDSRTAVILKQVENWHRWLGSRDIGKPVTGAACLCFFFLLLSGLFLWWPRKWTRHAVRAVSVPDFKLKGKARDWNRHNTVGLWAAPLLLVVTTTGITINYQWANDLLFVLTGNEPPPKPPEEKPKGQGKAGEAKGKFPAQPSASLDTVLAKAMAQLPGWTSITLRLPQKPGAPITASILEPGFFRRYARSQLTLNAASAGITRWEPYADQNLGRRLRSWVVPVHTGRAGGALGQFIALLASLAAILLVWTGAAMSWRRFSNAKSSTKSNAKSNAKPKPVPSENPIEPVPTFPGATQ